MKTRIEINGVWYVREDLISKSKSEFDTENVTDCETCTFETSDYCWEATRIRRSDGTFYPGIDIKFTDKTAVEREDWIEEHWDNSGYFEGLLSNNPDTIEESMKSMSHSGLETFKDFLTYLLEEKGWVL